MGMREKMEVAKLCFPTAIPMIPLADVRGFQITHQHVLLDVSLSQGLLTGITQIFLTPSSPDLRTIYLHFRQGRVQNVHVHSASTSFDPSSSAEFTHNDPLMMLSLSKPNDIHTFPEAKRKAFSAFAEGDQGELAIRLKDGLVERLKKDESSLTTDGEKLTELRKEVEYEAEKSGLLIMQPPYSKPENVVVEYAPLVVRIEWEVACGGEGLAWFGRGGDNDWVSFVFSSYMGLERSLVHDMFIHFFNSPFSIQHVPHIYTTPTTPDAARCWIPCVDNLWERCTWELDFIVPRRWVDDPLHGRKRKQKGKERGRPSGVGGGNEDRGDGEGRPVVVVCSGDLVEHVS